LVCGPVNLAFIAAVAIQRCPFSQPGRFRIARQAL